MSTYKNPFIYHEETAATAIAYIVKQFGRVEVYTLMKTIYLADKLHLSKYGGMITDDSYIAMQRGPAPSKILDALKSVRGISVVYIRSAFDRLIGCEGKNTLFLKQEPDLDYLSDSDIECLDEAIEMARNLLLNDEKANMWDRLGGHTHDDAFTSTRQTNPNGPIPIEMIASCAGAQTNVLEAIRTTTADVTELRASGWL